jgi:hypothetical protein
MESRVAAVFERRVVVVFGSGAVREADPRPVLVLLIGRLPLWQP